MPPPGDALEVVDPAVAELEARACDQLCDGAGDEHFPRRRLSGDTRAGVNRDAADAVVDQLDLAGVNARADVDPQVSQAIDDLERAADRARRTVERCEESVTGTLDLPSLEPIEAPPDRRVVLLEQLAPALVAELGGTTRRA